MARVICRECDQPLRLRRQRCSNCGARTRRLDQLVGIGSPWLIPALAAVAALMVEAPGFGHLPMAQLAGAWLGAGLLFFCLFRVLAALLERPLRLGLQRRLGRRRARERHAPSSGQPGLRTAGRRTAGRMAVRMSERDTAAS